MTLHPQAQSFIDMISANPRPGWEEMEPVEARSVFEQFEPFLGEATAIASIVDEEVNGVPIRIYDDRPNEVGPAIVYFHGGGFVMGSIQTHDPMCRQLCQASGCKVISVDYSLSPEAEFQTALQQCYSVIKHFARHGGQHNVDVARIAVAGDSAGGNLAACVSLLARDRAANNAIDWSIKLQVLYYPVIEPNFETESYQQFTTGYGLTRANMEWFWGCYLGDAKPTERAVPTKSGSLAGLPATHLITAGYDVLRDEGRRFAKELREAGVMVEHQEYAGMLHGFIHFSGYFDEGREALKASGKRIADFFGETV